MAEDPSRRILPGEIPNALVELFGVGGAGEGGKDVSHQGDHLLALGAGRKGRRLQEEAQVHVVRPCKTHRRPAVAALCYLVILPICQAQFAKLSDCVQMLFVVPTVCLNILLCNYL